MALVLARVFADTGSFIRGAIDLGVSMEESSAVAAPTMVSGVDIDDSGSEACEGGVWNGSISIPLCAGGGVRNGDGWGSLSCGILYLLAQWHLQPFFNKFLIATTIKARVVTVAHANMPNKEQEKKI